MTAPNDPVGTHTELAAINGVPPFEAMQILSLAPAEYGAASDVSPLEHVGVGILLAMYLLTWMGLRQNMTASVMTNIAASLARDDGFLGPLWTTFDVMLSLCNIFIISLGVLLVVGLIDIILIDKLWDQHPSSAIRTRPARGISASVFSWVFNVRVLVGLAVAQGMTAVVCFINIARLQALRRPATPLETGNLVDAVLTFNLVAVIVCITLQFVFQKQLGQAAPRI